MSARIAVSAAPLRRRQGLSAWALLPLPLPLLLLGLACAGPAAAPAAEAPTEAASRASPAPESAAPRSDDAGADAAERPAAPETGAAESEGGEPELPPLTDRERELGLTFQPLANEFGFTRYVSATRTALGRGLIFGYVPEDESLEDWHYLGTLTLTRVGDSWEDGVDVLPRYFAAFRANVPKINEAVTWTYPEGDVAFIDYERGSGKSHEHSLATIWQVYPGHLAVFQAQRRPERFSDWQVEHFQTVAQRLGRADR